MQTYAVILCTTPFSEAEKIAYPLVEEQLVACVNVANVNSFFKWQGNFEKDKEALLIMKTTTGKIKEVIERIKALHSYEVPEIIALPILDGNPDYLDWVSESVG